MSAIAEPFFVSTSDLHQQQYCFDGSCYNNQEYTDYPSPMSSPDTPELSEISESNLESNSCLVDMYDYCASPLSTTSNEDVNIDLNSNTTSQKGSYTNMNKYTDNNNMNISSIYTDFSVSNKSKKRSFSEVEDIEIFSNIVSMDEEEIDIYLNNIDLDLFPKVKSSSELLIFSPLSMKRFKLSKNKKSIVNDNNYSYELIDDNTPKIIEIKDEDKFQPFLIDEVSASSISQNILNSCSLNISP